MGSGFMYRKGFTGRLHMVVNDLPLCRAKQSTRYIISSAKPQKPMKLCATCELLKETDPNNVRGKGEKPSVKFYSSWEWKKARYETLKRYGAFCMCCGSDRNIVVDHIKPRSRFPELELDRENLQVLCNECNMGKSGDDHTDFRQAHRVQDLFL